MVLSPIKNCNNFIATRPAMVIFCTCLIIMIIAAFSSTLFIKYNDEIKNTDTLDNWISLSHYLSKLQVCASNKTYAERKRRITDEEATFATSITIIPSQFKNASKIVITYNLEGWRPVCPGDDGFESLDKTVDLTVHLNIPQVLNESETKICVLIKGPKKYLPEYLEPVCNSGELEEASATAFYSSFKKDTCPSIKEHNSIVKITFDGINFDKFGKFLNQDLGRKIRALENPPRLLNDVSNSLQEIWAAIPQREVAALIESIPNKI